MYMQSNVVGSVGVVFSFSPCCVLVFCGCIPRGSIKKLRTTRPAAAALLVLLLQKQ